MDNIIARLAIWIWIFQPGRKTPFKRTLCVYQEEFSSNTSISRIEMWAAAEVGKFRASNTGIVQSDVYGTLTYTSLINP